MKATPSPPLFQLVQEGNLEAIQAHLRAHPHSAREHHRGQLPLHEILSWWNELPTNKQCGTVHSGVTSSLIQWYPQALFEADAQGNTPLHIAAKLSERWGLRTFTLIYNGAKCVCSYRNKEGQLPVHLAMEYGNHEYVKALIQDDYCGMNAQVPGLLKLAITCDVRSDVIEELVHQNAMSTTQIDLDGLLPIQYALTNGNAPPSVLRALVQAYPESLSMGDKDGELPLHICAGYYRGHDSPTDRVQALNQLGQAFPRAYAMENKNGELPLHLAVLYESQVAVSASHGADDHAVPHHSVRVLGALTVGYPPAHETPDGHGNLPLHVACSYYQADLSLLSFLVAQNPVALRTVNYNGCLPLHMAAQSNLPVTAVRYILDQYPAALLKPDCEGNLPLHHAVGGFRECFGLECVELLVQHCPESTCRGNHKGELPWHLACTHCPDALAILDLLEVGFSPDAASSPMNPVVTP